MPQDSSFWAKSRQTSNCTRPSPRHIYKGRWGSDYSREETDRLRDYLFDLENPFDGKDPLNVVIHTPGYSTIYSAKTERHKKTIIPHIVATPVSYEPFSWFGEAVFRRVTKVVKLGNNKNYASQVSHHFCYRNVVVVSLRNYGKEEKASYLKVKYYLEGFPGASDNAFRLELGSPLFTVIRERRRFLREFSVSLGCRG